MKLMDFSKRHTVEIDGVSIVFRPMDIPKRNRWELTMEDVGILKVAKREDSEGKDILTNMEGQEIDPTELMEKMLENRSVLDGLLNEHIESVMHDGNNLPIDQFIRGVSTGIYWRIMTELYSASKLAEYETKN